MAEDGEKQPAAEIQAELVERHKAALIEINAAVFNQAQTYTTVVIFGAYAGLFGIWAFVREHIPRETTLTVAFCLGISIVTFALFEIFKMLFNVKLLSKMRRLILAELPPADFLAQRRELAVANDRATLAVVVPVWRLALVVTIATALIAGCELLHASWIALRSGQI